MNEDNIVKPRQKTGSKCLLGYCQNGSFFALLVAEKNTAILSASHQMFCPSYLVTKALERHIPGVIAFRDAGR